MFRFQMPQRPGSARVLLAATLVLAACSGSTTAPADAASDTLATEDAALGDADAVTLPAAITLGELLPRLADAACCRPPDCQTRPKAFAELPKAMCEGRALDFAFDEVRARIGWAARGRLHYDPVAAGTCLASLHGADAFEIGGWFGAWRPVPDGATPPAGCSAVFTGDKPDGAACEDDAECAKGRCWGCPGKCVSAFAGRDGACDLAIPCGPHDVCVQGTCRPVGPPAVGAACEFRASTFAVDRAECDPAQAFCATAGPHIHTCVALLADGQACDSSSQCSSTWCHGGTCAATSLLVPKGLECTQGTADSDCGSALVCVPDTAIGPGGGRCGDGWFGPVSCGNTTCPDGTFCSSPTKSTCELLPQPGDSCAGGKPCPGTCSQANVCVAMATCSNPAQYGACKDPNFVLPGDPCVSNADCQWGRWPQMQCMDGTCARWNPACLWKE